VSDHANHHSVSFRQLGWQQEMPNARTMLQAETVKAQWGNDAWQNEDAINWPHQRLECSSPTSNGEPCDEGIVDTSLNFIRCTVMICVVW